MNKKSSNKKLPPESDEVLSLEAKAIIKEILEPVFNMARTHKVMSRCPCIECFSDDLFEYINNKYEKPISDLLYEILITKFRYNWSRI